MLVINNLDCQKSVKLGLELSDRTLASMCETQGKEGLEARQELTQKE